MVIIVLSDVGVSSREASWLERLLGRVLSGRLDQELALGEAPESSTLLAVRACQLANPSTRTVLLKAVVGLLCPVPKPMAWATAMPTVNWTAVRKARSELVELSLRLSSPGPLPAATLARLRLLVTDGAGPLYYAGSSRDLTDELQAVLESIDAGASW